MNKKLGLNYRGFRAILVFMVTALLTACNGEEPVATTSFLKMRIVGVDQTAVSYTGTTETDPYIAAAYNATSISHPGMNLYFAKSSGEPDFLLDQYLRLSFLPNGNTRNVTYNSNVTASYISDSKEYVVTESIYTPMTMTINSHGDVGETIDGSFDATLCELDIYNNDRIDCLIEGNFLQIVGTFGIIREDDNI